MKRIITICSGNLCRSPMAERLVKREANDSGLSVAVISMGTLGLEARQAPREVIAVMEELGLDLRNHRSQGISLGILRHADTILVMEAAHERHLVKLDPGLQPKIVYAGSLDPDDPTLEVEDPIGKDRETYLRCRDRLVRIASAMRERGMLGR